MASNYIEVVDEEEQLLEQIEFEIRKIYASVEKLYNNQCLIEPNNPLEKCLITNYCYSSVLLDRGVDEEIVENEDSIKKFGMSVQQELNFLTLDLENIIKKMNDSENICSSIDTNISNLNSGMEASNKETSRENVNCIAKNIKLRFKKEKLDLKTIITTLFADNLDIQDLIARIIEHYFKEGSDKYLQLENEDNITEQIELLRRTNLFDINPHDILQIRLSDLL